ncbi:MAG: hypothetical protein NTW21_34705 [Verrucomicrobia bacterium]|nr:hypothetical protein [Verrucomicrobiota bacterium]
MRLPQKKKPGDPVLASDWNLLLEAIAARTPCPGTGLEFVASSGGFCYSMPQPLGQLPKGQPSFSVIAIARDGSNYLVTIREGWVIERQPKTGDHPAVKFHMPEYGGKALDSVPKPEISMAIGDTAWCRYRTDVTGAVTGTPEIIVAAANQDGVHYHPTDPEGSGGDGDYYVKLFKLELDDGVPGVRVYQQSDVEHWAQLWTGENVGTGAGVYKKHDEVENIFKFRSIRGEGITVTEDGDEILISLGGGSHLDLFAITLYCTTNEGNIQLTGSSDGYLYRWRHGIYRGRYAVNAGPLDGDAGLVIAVQYLTHLGF